MISRRSALVGLFAAPAIIAIDRLMPSKVMLRDPLLMPYKGISNYAKGISEFDAGLYYCPQMPWWPPAGLYRGVIKDTIAFYDTNKLET